MYDGVVELNAFMGNPKTLLTHLILAETSFGLKSKLYFWLLSRPTFTSHFNNVFYRLFHQLARSKHILPVFIPIVDQH